MKQTQYEDINAITYSSVVVSGFISKESNFADTFPFLKLHEKNEFEMITAISDDIGFAKKRLASPATVYSGLFDIMNYAVVNTEVNELESSLSGKDAWIAFNISSSDLPKYTDIASKLQLPRVVFGVHVTDEEAGPNVTFEDTCEALAAAGTNYTIIKFGEVREMAEARFPYRVRRGNESIPLPTVDRGQGQPLSSKDLYRVIVECVDLVKTFNKVYSVGPGTFLDSEVLTYMKAQGWPERVQVGMMMGDLMDSIERKYEAETERVSKMNATRPLPVSAASITASQRSKSTGFFG
eukprot:CAMPEP_0182427596 /NCGR_PEP_ID=MMETSP1167-20130531/18898_1 /TAXON_ID=2988 /ORGANISM="Mallomonas Sp, Strain CCMP3275" /LENGTH=294 /DNA_ID=CAMNT_0024609941 /DNA_START=202 /DNA_END=1086 /DNA_ORIENTATION=-